MMDQRITSLAHTLVTYSMKVTAGDNVLIEGFGQNTFEMIEALVNAVARAGANPFVRLYDTLVNRAILHANNDLRAQIESESDLQFMKHMNCYVAIRGADNILENSDVDMIKKSITAKFSKEVVRQRVNNTRWVVLRWPSATFAERVKMSTRAFEDFFFTSCLYDYSQLEKNMMPLKELMEKTDEVRILGPSVNLKFSIKGIPAIICAGEKNIPDGEIFTAPVKDSVDGFIHFNTPTIYQGSMFEGIHLWFKNGQITEATCSIGDPKQLCAILDTDDGARYIGEFGLGVNNVITKPMMDILFDEKIGGSFHLTPGEAYEDADNTNRSIIHWDMVMRQTAEHGGGEIWFDDVLVRKDG
ncbi:aminopeptidase, partial [Candidatus Falkowbacteria bacterium]|nr:aminopeptidase [Candidatus Falkowbacteria bacterium]